MSANIRGRLQTLSRREGFTIVELLVVIGVIAILATIVAVSYSGIQGRARDTTRLNSINEIAKALDAYKLKQGKYPDPAGSDWETSLLGPNEFLKELRAKGTISGQVPVDPVNDSSHYFAYFRYAAGDRGCAEERGAFYILAIKSMDGSDGPYEGSPGFSCPGRNWHDEFEWVTGRFENEE